MFERDGYLDARVADIVSEAELAHGSFYTYFDSKEDVFKVVAEQVVEEVLASLHTKQSSQMPTRERISAANADYLTVYKRHAKMQGLIAQVATHNDMFRKLRLDFRNQFVDRIAKAIDRLAEDDPRVAVLDSWTTASALGGMVDNLAYTWFVLGQKFTREKALKTIDAIWFRTLNLE